MNRVPDRHHPLDVIVLIRTLGSGFNHPEESGARVLRCTNHHPVSSSQLAVAATMLSGVYPPVHQIDDGARSTALTGASVTELLTELGYTSYLISLSPRVARLGRCIQGFEAVHTVQPADPYGSTDEAVISAIDRCVGDASARDRQLFLMLWLSSTPAATTDASGADLLTAVGHSLRRRTGGGGSLVIDLSLPAADFTATSVFETAPASPLCISFPPGFAPAGAAPTVSDCTDVAATIINAASDPETIRRWHQAGSQGTSLVELPAAPAAPARRLAYGESIGRELGIRCRSVRSRSWQLHELRTLAGGTTRLRWQQQWRRLLAATRCSRQQRGQLLDLIRHGVTTSVRQVAEPDPASSSQDTVTARHRLEQALAAWVEDCERIKSRRSAAAALHSDALNSRLRALGYLR